MDFQASLYGDLIDSYVQFKPLRKSDKAFEDNFSSKFEAFDKTYLKSADEKAGACGRIHEKLYEIIQSRWYMAKLPKLHKRIEDFKNSADTWYLNDSLIVEIFKNFNTEIYQELAAIESSYGRDSISESRTKLEQFITNWDTKVHDLRNQINDFSSLTDSML